VCAQHDRCLRQRRRDVVAVSDEGDRAAPETAPGLLQRETVGERLAGMFFVGERVEHAQPRSRCRKLAQLVLTVGPDDGGEHPSLEIPGDVRERFAPAERDVGARFDDIPSELTHRDLERRTRAERGLFEEQRDMTVLEHLLIGDARRPRRFVLRSPFETATKRLVIEIEDREEPCGNLSDAGHTCYPCEPRHLLSRGRGPLSQLRLAHPEAAEGSHSLSLPLATSCTRR
jgi:hypothetical protein